MIVTRNIDLSVGSTVGVAAYLTAELLRRQQRARRPSSPSRSPSASAPSSALVNGVLVAVAKVPSIIVTLGTLSIYRSVLTDHAGGRDDRHRRPAVVDRRPAAQHDRSRSVEYEVRTMFALALVIAVALHLVLQYTRAGRHLYAVGSNPEAARQAGLDDRRIQIVAFSACGALAGLAGFLYVGRFGTINVTAGAGLELAAIAAAVVGGVSTLGGSGTVMGAFLGAVLIGAARPEPRAGAADQRVLARRHPRRADPARRDCST